MEKISAILIVKNESRNLPDCLRSLHWVDEIVVLDTGSEDDTLQICRQYGCKTFQQSQWSGFGKAKQEVAALASNDWLLSIDADERLSPALQEELIALRQRGFEDKAWKLKRLSYYLGTAIRYCGWQNDAPLRIYNRKYGGFNDRNVHESIRVTQPKASCKAFMLHYTYHSQDSHFRKMRFYGDLARASMTKQSLPLEAATRAMLKFIKMYIFRLGFLDGYTGFLLCKNSAWGIWYKYHR